MKCLRCQHENAENAKFCQECGAALARSCVNCGGALPEKAKFCPACGHAAGQALSPSPPAAQPAPEGERRQVTVLFADISGYTQMCVSMDAEHVQALLNRFYALMDGVVAAYGGNVIDHAGDGVLAVFGAPVAHGDDPERAVRAALEMQTNAAQLQGPGGRPLQLHIGIASGEVVAAVLSGGATPKYVVTGDTVNLAARLDALAGPGDTIVSQAVHRSVWMMVETEDLGEKTVKGFAQPTRFYRVRALRHRALERLPFVGRQTELRQLSGALDSACETGTGVTIAVRGDPGIGKTRLMEELSSHARTQGLICHFGRVLDFGVAKGQEALPAVVAAMLGSSAHASEAQRRAALQSALDTRLVEAEHEAMITDLLDLPQSGELQKIFDAMDNVTRTRRAAEAVAALAGTAARQRPLLLVFEDIHWGSPLLLGVLAAVAMATREAPLVLALTTRFEGDPLDRHWRAASHATPLLIVDVGPLRPAEAEVLAGGMLETSQMFALECIRRAEGNPLFLEQLLRNARESESGNVPPTIQSLVLARMDRLPAGDKTALQAASVIGKRFELDVLRYLVENDAYRCDALVTTDLVRPEGGDYLFAHALIQEGVYSSLLHSRKRELHRRAAQWYAERDATLHAEHLDRAQHPAAAAAHLAAAQQEAKRFRYDVALRLVDRGAELAQEDELRHALAMLRGEVLRETGRTQDSIDAFRQALSAAASDEQRCRAWMGVAAGYRVTGEPQEAMHALDAAWPLAERLGLWSACSRIQTTRGNLYFALGKVAACREAHELALVYAQRAGDAECEAQAWSGLADHCYAEGRMLQALENFRRCVDISRAAGLVRSEIVNGCMAGHCLTWTGSADEGLREVYAAAEFSARIGLPQVEVMTLESIGFALMLRGDLIEAEPWIEKAIAVARQAGARRYLATDYLLMAACRRAQHRLAEARALVDDAIELMQQSGMGFLGATLYSAKARATEDLDERTRLLKEGEAMLHADTLAHAHAMFYRDAIDATLDVGQLDDAARYVDALERFVESREMSYAELIVARGRALIAVRREGRKPELLAELARVRDRLRAGGLTGIAAEVERVLGEDMA